MMSRELSVETRRCACFPSIVAALALTASVLCGAPREAWAQFHSIAVAGSPTASAGGTISYTLTVTSTSATRQIVVVARDSQDPTTLGSVANANALEWSNVPGVSWSGSNWVCNPPSLVADPGTPVCFYLAGFLPTGQHTPPLTLTFQVHQPTASDCWTVGSAAAIPGIPGPCAEMLFGDSGSGPSVQPGLFLGDGRVFTPIVSTGVTHWKKLDVGDWFDAGNWTNGVPGPGVSARFTIPAFPEGLPYTVNIQGQDAHALTLEASSGDVTILNSGTLETHASGTGIHVNGATLTLSGGGTVTDGLQLEPFSELAIRGLAEVYARGLTARSPTRIDLVEAGAGTGSLVIAGPVPNPHAAGTLAIIGPNALVEDHCVGGTVDVLQLLIDGVLSISCSPGTLHVTGDFLQTPAGTLEIEIGGPDGGDHLIVDGTATLGGTLEVRALEAPENLEFRIFPFLQAGAIVGAFDELSNLTGVNLALDATGQLTTGAAHVPLADAGVDQAVDEGALVTLDGSASSDPDGDGLTHHWTQVPGSYPVSLDLTDPVHPTFQAPDVPRGGATIGFSLVVEDPGHLASEPDVVNVTVKDVNHAPLADAGADQIVQEGSPVALDAAAGSYDPDGDALLFAWVQTAGPPVALVGADGATPSFVAPLVASAGETLRFEVTASDVDGASGRDQVEVRVDNVNHPPAADAGTDQTRDEGSAVVLDGTGSLDPDGDGLSYQWTQQSGPPVVLDDPTRQSPGFTAPSVGAGGADLLFELVVVDELGAASAPDPVTVHVQNLSDPPLCDAARPGLASLWPPDHKLASIAIDGVVDPNDDQVAIAVTGVVQDEPVEGLGDGDSSPDAVIQGGVVLLRSERSGLGDGRVYRVGFTATDASAGSCSGSVSVCVPKSRHVPCTDGSSHYDSTAP